MKKLRSIMAAILMTSLCFTGCSTAQSTDTGTEAASESVSADASTDTSTSETFDTEGEQTEFTVAFCTWIGYAPLYVAQEKGYFEEYGINPYLTIIEDESQYASAMYSNSIQALGNTLDREVIHYAQGTPEQVVFAMDESSGGDGIIASAEIQSVEDLRGKTVALDKSSTAYFFFLSILDDYGVSEDELTISEMGSYDAGSAFISGSVDAAVTWEPWISNAAEREGGHILATSKDYPKTIVDIMTMRSDFIENNPNTVKAFIQAWYKAVEFCKTNTEEANQIMAQAMGLEVEDIVDESAGVTFYGKDENEELFNKDIESNVYEVSQRAADFWQAKGIIEGADIDSFVSEILFE